MSVREVAERLRVKPATVYAYASRGLLHSRRQPGERQSWFNRSEVERLAASSGERSSMLRGLVVQSALTAIEHGRLYFRGRDAIKLAREHRFEDVANFLWTGQLESGGVWQADPGMTDLAARAQAVLPAKASYLERLRLAVTTIGVVDPFRHDLRVGAVVATTSTLLATAVSALPTRSRVRSQSDDGVGMAELLWSRLSDREPTEDELRLLDTAMCLLTEHELPPSTLAARLIASAGADPYGVIGTGMAISAGTITASASLAVESYLYDANPLSSSSSLISERLHSGKPVPGFGHTLYPDGDPRAVEILGRLPSVADPERMEHVSDLLTTLERRGLPPPNVGFALGALAYATKLAFGAGEAIFGVSRAVGWIAHALEEYENEGNRPRPRAVYIGPNIEESASAAPG
jgi:citrate synthase